MTKLIVEISEHQYNNIKAFSSINLARVPYKGIIMYAINAIKRGRVLEQEPILDKVRAEIVNHCGVNTDYCDSCRFCTDSIEVREILKIIDKYKTESEAEDAKKEQENSEK